MLLQLDPIAPSTPRLPQRRLGGFTQFAASAALHATLLAVVASIAIPSSPERTIASSQPAVITTPLKPELQRVVFFAPTAPRLGGGGGGGGNRQPGPVRRAQGVGADPVTLRVQQAPPAVIPVTTAFPLAAEHVLPLPSLVLDAKPMASGTFDQTGLPTTEGPVSGSSTGAGSGGGVGTGIGTGIGSGRGPGVGAGSGGGTGGGVYRPGGSVSTPRLIKQVQPVYTSGAMLNKIQGTVVLEGIVKRDGCLSQIRVVKSLDRSGLDEEAVAAVLQWRFEPGRLGGMPVDVIVTIMIDFWLR